MKRSYPLSRVRSALLLGAALPLLAGAEPPAPSPPKQRDWLATPPVDADPSFRDPRFELFPGAEDIGVPDRHGISPGLREEIRRHSERVLNQVSDELSTL